MSNWLDIRPANAVDLDAARGWLEEAGLPTADLTPDHMNNFLVAAADGEPVGLIGLEQFGNVGLLRSLVVDPSVRSGGVGRQLVAALEAKATGLGITELWLLTIDADPYFSRLDYVVTERTAVPVAIQSTAEFSSLCPGDAVLMRKKF